MQGYFFTMPMPQSEVETFIASFRMSDHTREWPPRVAARFDQRLTSSLRCRSVQRSHAAA
jgi:hypothetical protein